MSGHIFCHPYSKSTLEILFEAKTFEWKYTVQQKQFSLDSSI